VTVPAVETELAHVELVAVRDGLDRAVAHVRIPRRKEVPDARDRECRAEGAGYRADEWKLIPPGWEYLGQYQDSAALVVRWPGRESAIEVRCRIITPTKNPSGTRTTTTTETRDIERPRY
jgi:hypothetical protein